MPSNPNNGYLLPDPLTGYDTLCLKMQIPDNREYRAAIVGAITTLTKWWNWEKTGDNSGSIAAQYWLHLVLSTLEIGPCIDPNPGGNGEDSAGGGTAGDIDKLEEFLRLLQELDVKYRVNGKLYEAVIDLVECDCGSGSGDSDNSSLGTVPGGTPGVAYSGDVPTICDLITGGFAQYIANRVDDNVGQIQSRIFATDQILRLFDPPIVDNWLELVRDNADSIALQLQDQTFQDTLNTIFVQVLNDPVSPPLTRNNLYSITRKVPLEQEGAPMQAAFWLWAGTANLSEINAALPSYVGQQDKTICAEYFQSVGRVPYSGPQPNPTGRTDLDYVSQTGVDWTLTYYEVNAPYSFSLKPTLIPGEFGGRTISGAGAQLNGVNTVPTTNFSNVFRVRTEAGQTAFTVTMNTAISVYNGYDFVDAEFTVQDETDILALIAQIRGSYNPTNNGTATNADVPFSDQNVTFGSARTQEPGGDAEVVFMWFIHRATT